MKKIIEVDYEIDNGVPIPVRVYPALPLRDLEVGQSIGFPLERRPNVQSSASRLKKETGMEFTVRAIDDENARIWRTK